MKKFATVDEYLAAVPSKDRAALERIRTAVKSLVPDAREKIAYGIPTFTYHGNLVHFGVAKKHLSFYPGSRAVMKRFASELEDFETSAGATIRFQLDKPIPQGLLKKIILARAAENRARRPAD